MNKVELQGKIFRIFEGRRRTIVTLFVNGYRKNYPQIVFSTREGKEQVKGLKVGDFVHIDGTVKVRTERDENDHNYFVQFIKGLNIELAKSDLELNFGEDVKGKNDYINKVIISGTTVLTSGNEHAGTILVSTPSDKFNVLLTSYMHNANELQQILQPNDKIYVKAEIQTVRKEDDEFTKYFENLVVTDIVKNSNIEEIEE